MSVAVYSADAKLPLRRSRKKGGLGRALHSPFIEDIIAHFEINPTREDPSLEAKAHIMYG